MRFGRGTSLKPVPPVAPIGMGKDSRGVGLASVADLDERQVASWMKQATAHPRLRREEALTPGTGTGDGSLPESLPVDWGSGASEPADHWEPHGSTVIRSIRA